MSYLQHDVTLLAAEVSANGTTPALMTEDCTVARLSLAVSAVAGTTPSLTVTVQTSADGTNWYTAGAFTAATAVGSERKCFILDRYVRLSNAITGSGAKVTVKVSGEVL